MTGAVKIGVLNFISYFVLAVNFRAIAQGNYVATFLSDLLCGVLAFTIVKQIAVSNRKRDVAAYAVSGAFGAVCAIWATKHFLGA